MAKEFRKCKVEWCDKEVHANGLCSRHNHYYDKSGSFGGVYKITLDDKIYIGKSEISVKKRMNNEKSALKNNIHEPVAKELLDYFNDICIKEFGQDKYLDKDLRNKVIERMTFDTEIERFPFSYLDGSKFKDENEKKEVTYMWHIKYADNKMSAFAKKWYEKYMYTIDRDETDVIHNYEDKDRENETNKLLNINKRQYPIK